MLSIHSPHWGIINRLALILGELPSTTRRIFDAAIILPPLPPIPARAYPIEP
jgi:hypothetical protein